MCIVSLASASFERVSQFPLRKYLQTMLSVDGNRRYMLVVTATVICGTLKGL